MAIPAYWWTPRPDGKYSFCSNCQNYSYLRRYGCEICDYDMEYWTLKPATLKERRDAKILATAILMFAVPVVLACIALLNLRP